MNSLNLNFFKLGVFASCFTIASNAKAESNSKSKPSKPNILFCIADDASFAHFGANGCKWASTPAVDYLAANGINFVNAYTPNAKSAPSRACLLTGRNSWQLEDVGNHLAIWPNDKFLTYVEALSRNNYQVGSTGKGWAPGSPGTLNGNARELAGKEFNTRFLVPPTKAMGRDDYAANFKDFLDQKSSNEPWCFWFGCREPHREYIYGSGQKLGGKKLSDIDNVPLFWPDNDTVRNDMLDYAFEIEHFDKQLDKMIKMLTDKGELENTIIVVTSDNGMPFPRSKGLLYEYSNHMPLVVMWLNGIKNKGRVEKEYVSFVDIAPTFIQLAGLKWSDTGMEPAAGKSLQDIFYDKKKTDRSYILLGQERHDAGRPTNQGYPIRSIIKDGFLYNYNFKPELWPAGNPETGYLNTDGSPTKTNILNLRRAGIDKSYWNLCFAKHEQEELFQINVDKECLVNVADKPEFEKIKSELKKVLFDDLIKQKDPRVLGNGSVFDNYPLFQPLYQNFYERYMQGDKNLRTQTNWVNFDDYETESTQPVEVK